MSKTMTCKELGGICEHKFSGNTFDEIVQQGMKHMYSDDAHKKNMETIDARLGETKEQWMERMQKAFDAKPEDK